MNTTMLNTFVVAASTGSVSETAKKLRYGKSTVAYHIREVEKLCRAELFEREVRGLNLTRKGQVALEISQQLLRMAARLESLTASGLTDRLNGSGSGDMVSARNAREFG